VGYALKLAQRARALDQGIGLVRWTFDPLVSRNAWLNIGKLRATCDRFLPNFYGEMTDEINRGERSDRLVVRWDLATLNDVDREPVPPDGLVVLGIEGGTKGTPRPIAGDPPRRSEPALVRIPREYHDLRRQHPALGLEWRRAVGSALGACFEAGLTVSAFLRDGTYVLT
jgi:predicted GNAT superfamily acetyltransferase